MNYYKKILEIRNERLGVKPKHIENQTYSMPNLLPVTLQDILRLIQIKYRPDYGYARICTEGEIEYDYNLCGDAEDSIQLNLALPISGQAEKELEKLYLLIK